MEPGLEFAPLLVQVSIGVLTGCDEAFGLPRVSSSHLRRVPFSPNELACVRQGARDHGFRGRYIRIRSFVVDLLQLLCYTIWIGQAARERVPTGYGLG